MWKEGLKKGIFLRRIMVVNKELAGQAPLDSYDNRCSWAKHSKDSMAKLCIFYLQPPPQVQRVAWAFADEALGENSETRRWHAQPTDGSMKKTSHHHTTRITNKHRFFFTYAKKRFDCCACSSSTKTHLATCGHRTALIFDDAFKSCFQFLFSILHQ